MLRLKEKSVVPDAVRALVRDLMSLGLKVSQINDEGRRGRSGNADCR